MPQVDTLVHRSYFCTVAEAVALSDNMRLIQSPVFHAPDVKACRGLLAQGIFKIYFLYHHGEMLYLSICSS